MKIGIRCPLFVAALCMVVGCQRNGESETLKTQDVATRPGLIRLDPGARSRLGIVSVPVITMSIRSTIPAVGWLTAPPVAETIIRAPVAGYITATANQPWPALGQEISSTTTLAQLNVFLSPQEVSQLVQAKEDNDVQMQQALVTMDLAKAQLDLVSAARDAVTGVRVDQLKEAFERSKAAYKESQDKVPYLIQEPYEGGRLVKPVVVSVPRAGRILQVHCKVEQFMQAGDPLWTVADWSRLWLRVPVFERDARNIDSSQAAEIRNDNGQVIARVTPMAIPTEVKPATRTIDFYYEFENPGWTARVGQSMAVALPTSEKQHALLIPHSAVLYDGFGQAACYVSEREGTQFRRVRIELGTQHQDHTVVLHGLATNNAVVSVGAEQLAAKESEVSLAVGDTD